MPNVASKVARMVLMIENSAASTKRRMSIVHPDKVPHVKRSSKAMEKWGMIMI